MIQGPCQALNLRNLWMLLVFGMLIRLVNIGAASGQALDLNSQCSEETDPYPQFDLWRVRWCAHHPAEADRVQISRRAAFCRDLRRTGSANVRRIGDLAWVATYPKERSGRGEGSNGSSG